MRKPDACPANAGRLAVGFRLRDRGTYSLTARDEMYAPGSA